jgi:Fe-S cluster assembly protein SufB
VRKYLGSVVPQRDNYFACLNSAVFSDGTFVYMPEGVRCPMELSTYFRINAENTGQFERTLIIADKGAYVSYLEGCTAPMRDENQLHAAVVELVALDDARSNIRPCRTGIRATPRARAASTISSPSARLPRRALEGQLDPGRDRLAITWKYPSCILQGRQQRRRILFGRAHQQPPAGRHRHQDDPHRREHPLDDRLQGHQRRPLEQHLSRAGAGEGRGGVRNFTQCDSLLLGDQCGAHTVPYIEVRNPSAQIEHEATTSKISDDQLFYAMSRGLAGGGGGADRQRLRPRGAAAAADGVRGRGAEAVGDPGARAMR